MKIPLPLNYCGTVPWVECESYMLQISGVFFVGKTASAWILSGQIIATSAEVTPNGGLVREYPPNPLNSGLGIIVICPDTVPRDPQSPPEALKRPYLGALLTSSKPKVWLEDFGRLGTIHGSNHLLRMVIEPKSKSWGGDLTPLAHHLRIWLDA